MGSAAEREGGRVPEMARISLITLCTILAAQTAAGQTMGRCPGNSYSSMSWSDMSREKCLDRAYEMNQGPGPSGHCGHVSYSASSTPQSQGNFCRCYSSC